MKTRMSNRAGLERCENEWGIETERAHGHEVGIRAATRECGCARDRCGVACVGQVRVSKRVSMAVRKMVDEVMLGMEIEGKRECMFLQRDLNIQRQGDS